MSTMEIGKQETGGGNRTTGNRSCSDFNFCFNMKAMELLTTQSQADG